MDNKNKLFTLLCFILSSNVFALDYPTPNRFLVGINTYHRDYKEALNPPAKSNEAGQLYGISLGFETKSPNALMFSSELSIDGGRTNYDGAFMSSDLNDFGSYMGPAQGKTSNTFLNLDIALGYTFVTNDYHQFTPIIGFNSHRWCRGLIGYSESYSINSAIIGFQYDFTKYNNAEFGFSFKLLTPYHSDISVDFPYLGNVKMNLGKKQNIEIALPISFKMKPTCNNFLRIIPYYKLQRIGLSEIAWITPQIAIEEPASKAHVIGIKFLYLLNI